jgi:cytoskeletal protein RodZ
MKPEPNAFDPYHLWLQIPKEFRPPTHYQLLGLSVGESNEEVIRQATLMRSAYVRHFQNGPNAADATRILEELADANRVLIDPSLRAEYEAKIKPVAKPTPKPVLSNAGPVTIPKPKAPTADYDLVDDRRPKAKKKKSKRRDSLFGTVLGLVFAVAGIAGIVYLANIAFREPNAALTVPEGKKPDVESIPSKKDADLSSKPSPPSHQPKPRPADAVIVRLSVEPASAELTLEPIGASNASSGPKASIEGDGGERTIVAEKGALPIVVAGTAAGHQPTRVTVFSSDAGRLVVVQLQKQGARGSSGGGFTTTNSNAKRRPVGSYQVGIPLSTKDAKPVWKYTVSRPAPDWASVAFGDALWSEGEAAFGVKAGRNAVKSPGLWIRTPWSSQGIWLRGRVVLPKAAKGARIRWSFRNDNEVSVFVNGSHQFTERSTSWAPQTRVMESADFQAGENVIGVHCHNTGGPGLIDVGFEWIAMEEVK